MISLLLFTISFFALFGIVHGLRTRQLNGEDNSRKWHKIQAAMHVVFALFMALHFSFLAAVIAFFFTLTIIWIVFDLSHNLTTKQEWYYAENSGLNGAIKKRGGEITVLAVKAILFSSLLILFILL